MRKYRYVILHLIITMFISLCNVGCCGCLKKLLFCDVDSCNVSGTEKENEIKGKNLSEIKKKEKPIQGSKIKLKKKKDLIKKKSEEKKIKGETIPQKEKIKKNKKKGEIKLMMNLKQVFPGETLKDKQEPKKKKNIDKKEKDKEKPEQENKEIKKGKKKKEKKNAYNNFVEAASELKDKKPEDIKCKENKEKKYKPEIKKEEEERLKKQEEEKRKKLEEDEKKRKEEEERLKKEEEKKRKEEEEIKKEEEDRLKKEEEERKRKEDEERKRKEDEERRKKEEEEERKRKEEEEKIRRENEERIKREEEEEIIKKLKLIKSRYRLIQKQIGKGGWGTVHKYYDDENNENVAIKILSPKTAGIDECKILEILKDNKPHVNIVEIKDIFEDGKDMFFVEEFCEYNLITYYNVHKVTEGKYNFTDEERMCLFFQLINGLEFLHKLNIAHRDLKRKNLLVTKEGILKICDFGECYHCEQKGKYTTSRKGTEGHMAPEIYNGEYHDPFKADIWSCGIILWAMFNYHSIIKPPGKGTRYDDYYEKYKNITIDDLKNCENESVKKLVFKMLSYDPKERPTIEEIKETDLYIKGKESFIKKYHGKIEEEEIKKQQEEKERLEKLKKQEEERLKKEAEDKRRKEEKPIVEEKKDEPKIEIIQENPKVEKKEDPKNNSDNEIKNNEENKGSENNEENKGSENNNNENKEENRGSKNNGNENNSNIINNSKISHGDNNDNIKSQCTWTMFKITIAPEDKNTNISLKIWDILSEEYINNADAENNNIIPEENIINNKEENNNEEGTKTHYYVLIKDITTKANVYKSLFSALEETAENKKFSYSIEIIDANTTEVTDMSWMFFKCEKLIKIEGLDKWDTSKVTDMSFMFSQCNKLESLQDISKWDTKKVTNMSGMFFGCSSLKELPDKFKERRHEEVLYDL